MIIVYPSSFGISWQRLQFLSLSTNQLSNTIPMTFRTLSFLDEIYLDHNQFNGTLDTIFGPKDNNMIPTKLEADCLSNDPIIVPEITCTCCTTCH